MKNEDKSIFQTMPLTKREQEELARIKEIAKIFEPRLAAFFFYACDFQNGQCRRMREKGKKFCCCTHEGYNCDKLTEKGCSLRGYERPSMCNIFLCTETNNKMREYHNIILKAEMGQASIREVYAVMPELRTMSSRAIKEINRGIEIWVQFYEEVGEEGNNLLSKEFVNRHNRGA